LKPGLSLANFVFWKWGSADHTQGDVVISCRRIRTLMEDELIASNFLFWLTPEYTIALLPRLKPGVIQC
jgi:hypothetical protein